MVDALRPAYGAPKHYSPAVKRGSANLWGRSAAFHDGTQEPQTSEKRGLRYPSWLRLGRAVFKGTDFNLFGTAPDQIQPVALLNSSGEAETRRVHESRARCSCLSERRLATPR